ncbi:hypothetical protein AALO_G00222850, partial [Alosa alosa]
MFTMTFSNLSQIPLSKITRNNIMIFNEHCFNFLDFFISLSHTHTARDRDSELSQ